MTDNILFYYLGKNKTLCVKFSVSFQIEQGKFNFVKYMNRFIFKIVLLIDTTQKILEFKSRDGSIFSQGRYC